MALTKLLFIGSPTCDASNAFKMYRRNVLTEMMIEKAGFASSLEIVVTANGLRCSVDSITGCAPAQQDMGCGRGALRAARLNQT